MNLLWILQKKNISVAQIVSFIITNILGLSILLFSILLYIDIVPLFSSKTKIDNDNYIVITKNIGSIGSVIGAESNFSELEIEEIKQQVFAQSVGLFTSSQYNVWAEVNIDKQYSNLSTAMFFESVPDNFIDVDSKDWNFNKNSDTIPIIIPRDYLDLYNFGFAEAQDLPKISEKILNLLSLKIRISGNNQHQIFTGKIVGFTNRINTILLPEDFMKWSNLKFANFSQTEHAKIIVKVQNLADENIVKFTNEKGYNVNNNSTNSSKTAFILKIMISILLSKGLLISILSLYILTLSIHLLIQKNKEKIQNLHLIGYSTKQIAKPYILLTTIINIGTFSLSIIFALLARIAYLSYIRIIFPNYTSEFVYLIPTISITILSIIILYNYFTINNKINIIKTTKK